MRLFVTVIAVLMAINILIAVYQLGKSYPRVETVSRIVDQMGLVTKILFLSWAGYLLFR